MTTANPRFPSSDVALAFAAFPTPARACLMELRHAIYDAARNTPGVGALEETLKWGQPAYLTSESKSGSTLRLGVPKSGGFAIYAHCQTSIIPAFRDAFGNALRYDGNRGVVFDDAGDFDPGLLRPLIVHALTYHLR